MRLLEPLFRWEKIEELFSDRARLQGMLDFEAALAHAEARAGVIPASGAVAIAARCRAELFDMDLLARATALAGNPAMPMVEQLTALVGRDSEEAMRFVHWGATSQDAIDTGFTLQLRRALDRIDAELETLSGALAELVQKHRATPVVGRTLMQHALPMTFGFKAAGWLDAITRHRERLRDARRRALVVQFGGAVGTLAALGTRGVEVTKALGEEVHLAVPDVPWHVHRDRWAEVAATLGLCTGTLGKIARDVALQMQTEVAEVFEPAGAGRGGSSTLPHKRNPIVSAVVLAAAARMPGLVGSMLTAMVQEQERGLGGWHAEWETMPEIIGVAGGALHHVTCTMIELEVDVERMRENLDLTHGLIFAESVQMALGSVMGRMTAHKLVEAACKQARAEKRHLRAVLEADGAVMKHLNREQLERLFDPRHYLGVVEALIDRVLRSYNQQDSKPPGTTKQ